MNSISQVIMINALNDHFMIKFNYLTLYFLKNIKNETKFNENNYQLIQEFIN